MRVDRTKVRVTRYVGDVRPAQFLCRESGSACRQRIAQSAIDQKLLHGIRERVTIAWRDNQSGRAVDYNVGHIAYVSRYNRS